MHIPHYIESLTGKSFAEIMRRGLATIVQDGDSVRVAHWDESALGMPAPTPDILAAVAEYGPHQNDLVAHVSRRVEAALGQPQRLVLDGKEIEIEASPLALLELSALARSGAASEVRTLVSADFSAHQLTIAQLLVAEAAVYGWIASLRAFGAGLVAKIRSEEIRSFAEIDALTWPKP